MHGAYQNYEQAHEDIFHLGMQGTQGYKTIGSNDTHTRQANTIQEITKDPAVY